MAVVEPFGKHPVDFLVTLGLVCGPGSVRSKCLVLD
jgi:hypothetical protein